MVSVDAGYRSFDVVASKRWGIYILAFLGLTLVLAAAIQKQISCDRHRGSFAVGFSPAFDIDRTDCRLARIKSSPTVHFWKVYPYMGIEWDVRTVGSK